MNPARIAVIAVALVAAIGLALFVHSMFQPKSAPPTLAAAPTPAMTRVLVAKADLAVGDKLSAENMTWQSWPTTTLNVAYITDGETSATPQGAVQTAIAQGKNTVNDIANAGGPKLQAMVGSIVRQPMFAGQPITSKDIVRSGDSSYMAVRLPEGMRAVALPLTLESGVGGFIEPGDHVDILSTHNDTTPNSPGGMITETVLENVPVLAIDQHTDQPKEGAAIAGATVTIEIPAGASSAVAHARTIGGLTLVLRSYADIGGKTNGDVAGDQHAVRIFRGGAPAQVVTAQ